MLTKTERKITRRNTPTEPRMKLTLQLDLSFGERIEAAAKANCRTMPEEIKFRLLRDIKANADA